MKPMSEFLNISQDDFKKGYDYNFVPYIEVKQNLDYVNWASAVVILKELFPNLLAHCDPTKPSFIYKNLDLSPLGEKYFFDYMDKLSEKMVDSKDYKEKNRLAKEYQSLHNSVLYNYLGLILHPYLIDLETGKESVKLDFPVTDYNNESIVVPCPKEISNSVQRAKVKAIATFTGIGLRLWSRDGIDLKKKGDKLHPQYVRLKKLHEIEQQVLHKYGTLPEKYTKCDFGSDYNSLINSFNLLTNELK